MLRIYDCTTYNNPPPPGVDEPYIPVPGLELSGESHIPGADFLDLQGEFSDKSQRHWFMMPKDARSSKRRSHATASAKACGSCSTASAP